jgi:hypothetical protein
MELESCPEAVSRPDPDLLLPILHASTTTSYYCRNLISKPVETADDLRAAASKLYHVDNHNIDKP